MLSTLGNLAAAGAPFLVLTGALTGGFIGTLGLAPALGQVVADTLPDRALGSVVAGNCVTNNCRIMGGTAVGENLFHSFSQFELLNGREARFVHDPSVERIFSRVTGGSRSIINGLLQTDGASLFFLSPQLILFGSQAQLDVRSTFVGSTASEAFNGGGGQFNVTNFAADQLFAGAPSVFSFNSSSGAIEVTGDGSSPVFNPNPGEAIALVGGPITIQNRQILLPQDQFVLGGFKPGGGVLSAGGSLISLSILTNFSDVEDVLIENSQLTADPSAINGEVQIRAQVARIIDSTISTLADKQESKDGNIRFSLVGGELHLTNSMLLTQAIAGGSSGDIFIGNLSGTPEFSFPLVDKIELKNSSISTQTEGSGGRVQFPNVLDKIILDDSRITTNILGGNAIGAGSVFLSAINLELKEASQVRTLVDSGQLGQGQGEIKLNGFQQMTLDNSEVSAIALPDSAAGNIQLGGFSVLTSQSLLLDEGSQVFSQTSNPGGNISLIFNNDIDLKAGSKILTQGLVNSLESGNIEILAEDLTLEQSSQITTMTAANNGAISLRIFDRTQLNDDTLIQAEAGQPQGGSLTINTSRLQAGNLSDDGDIIMIGPQDNLSLNASFIQDFSLNLSPQQGNRLSEIGYRQVSSRNNSSGNPPSPPITPPATIDPPAMGNGESQGSGSGDGLDSGPRDSPPLNPGSLPGESPWLPPQDSTRTDPTEPGEEPQVFSWVFWLGAEVAEQPPKQQQESQLLGLWNRSSQARTVEQVCRSGQSSSQSDASSGLTLSGKGGVAPTPGSLGGVSPLLDLGLVPSPGDPQSSERSRLSAGFQFPLSPSLIGQSSHRANPLPSSPLFLGEASRWRRLRDGRIRLMGSSQFTAQTQLSCS